MMFSELLKNSVDESELGGLRKELLRVNILRGELLARVVTVIEIIFCIISVAAYVLKADNRFRFQFYLLMYSIMIIINSVFLLTTARSKRHKEINSLYVKRWEIYIMLYMTFLMVWGSVVSLVDQELYGQIMVYMINLMACSIFFYLDNKKVLVPIILSALVLMLGLPFFQTSTDVLIGHYVNLIVSIIMAWCASRILYTHYCNDFKSKTTLKKTNALLADEIEHNRVINAMLEKANEDLKELTLIDELTGIPNRRSLNNYIDFSYIYKIKNGSLFSVIMMDIDYFKQYNDNYGHNAGDGVLFSVAQEINAVVRYPVDFAARYGGEEFILVSFGTDEKYIRELAETIKNRIMDLNIEHGFSRISNCITLSLGTSTVTALDKEDIFNCIEFADRALYSAKANGRNRVESMQCS